jgi:hypothetical protein
MLIFLGQAQYDAAKRFELLPVVFGHWQPV